MRSPKLLSLVVAAFALSSCAVYMHEDHAYRHHRRAYAGEPASCPHHAKAGVIGLSIGRGGGERGGPIVIERVVPGGPAAEAAIRPGDRIRAIDGETTRGMTVSEASRLIRGRPGTSIELRVDSPRGERLITLVRVPACHVWGPSAELAAPSAPPPVDADDALAPEVWPPTKPGHGAS